MAETIKHPTVLDSEQQYLGDVYAKALLGASEKAGNTDQRTPARPHGQWPGDHPPQRQEHRHIAAGHSHEM